MSYKTTPITLITGYLGSGKTTLINHILSHANKHKLAVIVNDLGEINIDAELIQKGGVVSSQDDNLVSLQNGCICCTLKKDLITQLADLINSQKFDHILIEASGICEPIPIAQTIEYMKQEFKARNLPMFYKLDAIISVTDALRLRDEFNCGEVFNNTKRGEEDLENLIIQQIEFCDIILLNKASEVTPTELNRIKDVIKHIQPVAKIIETDYCDLPIELLLDTDLFDYEKAFATAAWVQELDSWDNEHEEDEEEHDEHEHEHEHHHHHHHEHGIDENDDSGTADEYNVNTFVYYRRKPLDKDKFMAWVNNNPRNIIRSKGIVYFVGDEANSYVYESAGKQRKLTDNGQWYSETLSQRQISNLIKNDKNYAHDWDDVYKDKLVKLVFIGQNLDKEGIKKELDQI